MEKRGPECTRGVLRHLHCQEMALRKKGEIWTGCKETRGCLRGLGGQKTARGPNSVEKRAPELTAGVLRCLHCPEMPLGKKGEIWRGCQETRGCLRGQKRAGGPHSVEKRGPEHTRGVLRCLHGLEMPLREEGRNLEGLRGD